MSFFFFASDRFYDHLFMIPETCSLTKFVSPIGISTVVGSTQIGFHPSDDRYDMYRSPLLEMFPEVTQAHLCKSIPPTNPSLFLNATPNQSSGSTEYPLYSMMLPVVFWIRFNIVIFSLSLRTSETSGSRSLSHYGL